MSSKAQNAVVFVLPIHGVEQWQIAVADYPCWGMSEFQMADYPCWGMSEFQIRIWAGEALYGSTPSAYIPRAERLMHST